MLRMTMKHWLYVLFALAAGNLIQAQTQPADVITTGDLLLVEIHDLKGMGAKDNFDLRVDDEGKVGVPLVRRIEVQNLRFSDAEKKVAKAFADQGWLMKARVAVSRTEESTESKVKPVAPRSRIRCAACS